MLLKIHRVQLAGFLFVAIALFGACSKKKATTEEATAIPPVAYCPYLPSKTFSGGVTVTGMAEYQWRLAGNGALSSTGTHRPIRYAEVMVKNSTGTVVQCAETDGNGDFSFQLSANSGTYTVYVNSRGNNSNVKSYVMTDPTNNTHYSISTTVSTTGNSTISLLASGTNSGTVTGGAFNIFDQVVNANIYLAANANSTSCATLANDVQTQCAASAFTVAPLSYVYWKKGFNPNSYLGEPSEGVSFFLRGTNELYILGGIDDDIIYSDTDHYDNSIILHEYGHFIEEVYSKSDSQGGSHYADYQSEPRLVWSEAFANFFQAAVTNVPIYRDTVGNTDCVGGSCTGYYHNENLETYTASPTTGYDNPASVDAGEGSFREFALTRTLWDAIDTNADTVSGTTDSVVSPFAEFWAVFAGPNQFKHSSRRFRNAGLFFKLQAAISGSTDWSDILTIGRQRADQQDYGATLTVGSTCSVTMTPVTLSDGSFDASDLFNENDYYAYYHSGGTLRVLLTYTVGSSPITNLDLFIWKDGYFYGDTADLIGSSGLAHGDADGRTEEVSVTAPAGWYMINVFGDQNGSQGSASTYNLKIYKNGALTNACPTAGS